MTQRDQLQNGMSLPPAPIPSYAPIRAQIAAALSPEDRDHASVTEICLIVAALAHGNESAWLQTRGRDLGDAEARRWIEDAQEAFAKEIAGVRRVSQALAALVVGAGLPVHLADAGVNVKLAEQFFEMPSLARRYLRLIRPPWPITD